MQEIVSLKSDLAFRAVFGRENDKCKQALIALLNDVLDLHITQIAYKNPLQFPNFDEDKLSEMDIAVTNIDGENIDIEIQLRNKPCFSERMIYYNAKQLSTCIKEGENYCKMKKCTLLAILDFTLFPTTDRLKSTYRYLETTDQRELSGVAEIDFLEMSKLDTNKPVNEMNDIEMWLYFIRYVNDPNKQESIKELLQKKEGIAMTMDVLQEVSADERMCAMMISREKAYRDQIALMDGAHEQGFDEGFGEGFGEGERKKALSTAQMMIDDGETIEKIVRYTGLSLDEVKRLQDR